MAITQSYSGRLILGLALLLGLLTSCSDSLLSGATPRDITVTNATSDTLIILAAELETASRLDLNPRMPRSAVLERMVLPGGSLVVPAQLVEGYRAGADVRFFVYDLAGADAVYRTHLTLTGAQLSASDFRVELSAASIARYSVAYSAMQQQPLFTIVADAEVKTQRGRDARGGTGTVAPFA